jgi:protein-S-isoprenylcysteine O-methyltransferase Ste14
MSISRLAITPTFIIGNLLTCLGALIRLSSYRSLGRLFSFELSLLSDHRLVNTGPYGIVRHPSYTGMTLGILGAYFNHIQGSWVSESGLAKCFAGEMLILLWVTFSLAVIVSLVLRIPIEDDLLKQRFGQEWAVWADKVPHRLIPCVY